ncbi:MAG: SDR family oxidoreductase [Prochloraceae cyanobacterium]
MNKNLGIVITGGSKGLGYAMAREFLLSGDRVVICARDKTRLENAVRSLKKEIPTAEVYAIDCDVSNNLDVERLENFVKEKLVTIDRWINNAGRASSKRRPLWDLEAEDIAATCHTNLLGSMLLCAAAIRLMKQQKSSHQPIYHIFNLGFSNFGANFSKSTVPHKASKRGVAEITHFLGQELKQAKINSIGVHELSPGLVLTDLLLADTTPKVRKFFNALAEEADTVAAYLVPKIRNIQGSNTNVRYLTPLGASIKIIFRIPQIINGGRFFDNNGDRVVKIK